MQMEVIPSPQTSAPVTLHSVTSQTWDLNILVQQESCIEYIPVCRIVMLCCWASSSWLFEGLWCLFSSGSGRPRTIAAFCLLQHSCSTVWSDSKFACGHISPLFTVHYPTLCQPQSVHSFGILIAENITLPQLCDFRLRMRCKWDLRSFGILRSADW